MCQYLHSRSMLLGKIINWTRNKGSWVNQNTCKHIIHLCMYYRKHWVFKKFPGSESLSSQSKMLSCTHANNICVGVRYKSRDTRFSSFCIESEYFCFMWNFPLFKCRAIFLSTNITAMFLIHLIIQLWTLKLLPMSLSLQSSQSVPLCIKYSQQQFISMNVSI